MTSGYAITIKGFLPVNPDDLDDVLRVGKEARWLLTLAPESPDPLKSIGAVFVGLADRAVTIKYVNRREPKAPTP